MEFYSSVQQLILNFVRFLKVMRKCKILHRQSYGYSFTFLWSLHFPMMLGQNNKYLNFR